MDETNVFHVTYLNKQLTLIGTAHVSNQSKALTEEVLLSQHFDAIAVELDQDRYQSIQDPARFQNTDIVEVIKQKRTGFLLANLILSQYQKKMANHLGSDLGGEMLAGIRIAKQTGAKLVLADRPVATTFLRVWRKLTFFEKLKLLVTLVFSFGDEDKVSEEQLEKMMEEDMLESALSQVRKSFPKVGEVLIDERDKVLAYNIKRAYGTEIAAVLGRAHIPGILSHLNDEEPIDEYLSIPPKSLSSKLAVWIIPLLIVGLIALGFVNGFQNGLKSLGTWVIINACASALFTALALAHPLTILTSFLLSPFSALNPFVAVGFFAGLVEAWIKKPTVRDMEALSEEFTLKGFYTNRFLRILLIVIMANLGSTLGTLLSSLGLFKNLF
ncbi:MAG: TraB/GumN family protein [Erysipelotrichaceae bacterium]|jgi:pheromone shutdown-related protein TraB|nr:TraB/GumN family protein [Erysipelotrichaceae bacterium]